MTAPRSDLLAALPGLIAGKIGTMLPGLRTAEGIVGRIDLAEVNRRGIASPAVLVSWYGGKLERTAAGPQRFWRIDMSAFVITRDVPGLDRNEAAATIVQALLSELPDHCWDEPGLGHLADVSAHSLITTDVLKAGVALWAVTWRQEITFEGAPAPEDVPLRLYVGIAPEIGAAHEDDYELIGGEA